MEFICVSWTQMLGSMNLDKGKWYMIMEDHEEIGGSLEHEYDHHHVSTALSIIKHVPDYTIVDDVINTQEQARTYMWKVADKLYHDVMDPCNAILPQGMAFTEADLPEDVKRSDFRMHLIGPQWDYFYGVRLPMKWRSPYTDTYTPAEWVLP